MAETAINRNGFGQVEPNHLSMQQTGQIYAQLPAKKGIEQLENGQYVKYDYENNEINFTGEGEWMMVFNEVKLYGDAYIEFYKDYAMQTKNFTEGEIVPRVVKTNIGDIYTTNTVGKAGSYRTDVASGENLKVGDKLSPNANGFLTKTGGDASMVWNVVKVYTMADGQPAVKIQRIK